MHQTYIYCARPPHFPTASDRQGRTMPATCDINQKDFVCSDCSGLLEPAPLTPTGPIPNRLMPYLKRRVARALSEAHGMVYAGNYRMMELEMSLRIAFTEVMHAWYELEEALRAPGEEESR